MRPVIVVTGSRNWSDRDTLDDILNQLNPALVVEGGAKGADTMAREWCDRNGVTCVEVPALWTAHGKSAGPKRNSTMLRIAQALAAARDMPVEVVACPHDDSVGTKHMMSLAHEAGLCMYVVKEEPS